MAFENVYNRKSLLKPSKNALSENSINLSAETATTSTTTNGRIFFFQIEVSCREVSFMLRVNTKSILWWLLLLLLLLLLKIVRRLIYRWSKGFANCASIELPQIDNKKEIILNSKCFPCFSFPEQVALLQWFSTFFFWVTA